jgi:hypothetical protein
VGAAVLRGIQRLGLTHTVEPGSQEVEDDQS